MMSSTPTFRLDILPPATKRALDEMKAIRFLAQPGWYLSGGTALALQVGHRQSVDLDFFRDRGFQEEKIERALFETGAWFTNMRDKGTLYGEFMGAKASFIAYPFFTPSKPRMRYGTISILASFDIAAMKIIA